MCDEEVRRAPGIGKREPKDGAEIVLLGKILSLCKTNGTQFKGAIVEIKILE